jgi:hypothetical protein
LAAYEDANLGAVNPFDGVTIANEAGQETVATITFRDEMGDLSGAGLALVGGDPTTGVATYTVTGTSPDNLQELLGDLTFDPRNLGAVESEDVVFTLKVMDA